MMKDDVDVNLKNNLLEIIHSVQEKIKASDSKLTKDEIALFFKDITISFKQQNLIYEYLLNFQEEIQCDSIEQQMDANTMDIKLAECSQKKTNFEVPETEFFRLYLQDLQKIVLFDEQEEKRLYEGLLAGDEKALHTLSEQWMPKVLQIARKRIKEADKKEFSDMIQEGNIGVFFALQQMMGSDRQIDFEQELTKAAEDAMDQYMQKMSADADMDQSLLAKAALVYEAQKFLSEQFQRLPSTEELSQYTKMTENELEDIFAVLKKSE